MVLTAYFVLSPVTVLFCHRRLTDIRRIPTRLGGCTSARLDASVGASGPHDFAVRCNISRPHAVDRSQAFRQPALQSRRAQNAAASTASNPASVTIAIRPSVGWTSRVIDVIWGKWEPKYFSEKPKNNLTRHSTSRPTGKSPEPVLLSTPSVFRMNGSRKPSPGSRGRSDLSLWER